jgi:hypothetical protein
MGDKAAAAQVILDELNSEVGGAAKAAADEYTQAINALGDQWEDLGKVAIPILTWITKELAKQIVNAKELAKFLPVKGGDDGLTLDLRFKTASDSVARAIAQPGADNEATRTIGFAAEIARLKNESQRLDKRLQSLSAFRAGELANRALGASQAEDIAGGAIAAARRFNLAAEERRFSRLASSGHNLARVGQLLRRGGQAFGGLSNIAGGAVGQFRQRQARAAERAEAIERIRSRAITSTAESRFRDRIGFLKGAEQAGAIDAARLATESRLAQQQFAQAKQQGGVSPTLSTALIKGSQAAFNAIARFAQRRSNEELLLKAQQETLRQAEIIAENTAPQVIEIPAG